MQPHMCLWFRSFASFFFESAFTTNCLSLNIGAQNINLLEMIQAWKLHVSRFRCQAGQPQTKKPLKRPPNSNLTPVASNTAHGGVATFPDNFQDTLFPRHKLCVLFWQIRPSRVLLFSWRPVNVTPFPTIWFHSTKSQPRTFANKSYALWSTYGIIFSSNLITIYIRSDQQHAALAALIFFPCRAWIMHHVWRLLRKRSLLKA